MMKQKKFQIIYANDFRTKPLVINSNLTFHYVQDIFLMNQDFGLKGYFMCIIVDDVKYDHYLNVM